MAKKYERDKREGNRRNQPQNPEREGPNRWPGGVREGEYGWSGQGEAERNWRDMGGRQNDRGWDRQPPYQRGEWNQNMGGGWNQGMPGNRENWRDRWNPPEQGQHAGRGPRSYKRQDNRIEEDVNEQLTRHSMIDASDIEVQVQDGEVTLRGYVDSRDAKRMAEDVAESVFGVKDIHNQIKVKQRAEGEGAKQDADASGKQRDRKAS